MNVRRIASLSLCTTLTLLAGACQETGGNADSTSASDSTGTSDGAGTSDGGCVGQLGCDCNGPNDCDEGLSCVDGTCETTTEDSCPDNDLKTEPGVCGCDEQDLDLDNDGTIDCVEEAGWTDLTQFLVPSDGTHSLGDPSLEFNNTRDQGSKIVYFDVVSGDNDTAAVYWWDGQNLVDSDGSTTNPDNDESYGTDPLAPNENAIRPFQSLSSSESDPRLVTQNKASMKFERLAGGYPDWFLFRRGEAHTTFDQRLVGGRSEEEPMVVAAYGPVSDGRAIIEPDEGGTSPFTGNNSDHAENWLHQVVASLEIHSEYGWLGTNEAMSKNGLGGPVTAVLEDCDFPSLEAGGIIYPPRKTTVRRSIVTGRWDGSSAHVTGYFNHGFNAAVTFAEVIFYRNGFASNPVTEADPAYDKFSRNFYQGGGAQMGHAYINVISADGGSGGPQMRLGGLMEGSLVVEGYFYSSTASNVAENEWLETGGQTGQSALVRNNVQLIYGYPTANDPDTDGTSDTAAQPGNGYSLQGESFGALVEGNVISGAMLADDLGGAANKGITLAVDPDMYANGVTYTQKNNVVRNNIVYRAGRGLSLEGDATDASNIVVSDNIFVTETPVSEDMQNLNDAGQISVDGNRFYSNGALPGDDWFGVNNSLGDYGGAAAAEGWTDPDRTLKRYVVEVLNLTLLDWSDDSNIDDAAKQVRIANGEEYDPTGLKTFMAVATHMRHGGTDSIPSSGKPSMSGDYPWDERFTAKAVVNWIRAGFGLDEVD